MLSILLVLGAGNEVTNFSYDVICGIFGNGFTFMFFCTKRMNDLHYFTDVVKKDLTPTRMDGRGDIKRNRRRHYERHSVIDIFIYT